MQISSKEIISLIGLTSIIFLIAPLFLILYVLSYNRRKKKYQEETVMLQKNFDTELLKTQMEVQEQTLKTVAYDLHDNIGQLLSLTTITLSSINLNDNKNTAEKISLVEDLTMRSIKEVKALSRLLHGEEIISRGLKAAIEFELEWLKRSDKFQVSFTHNNIPFNGDSAQETILFRLFQEIINNIIQHAKATVININLQGDVENYKMIISDNGVGFDVEKILARKAGMGLHNIIKRSNMINGNAAIVSTPVNGTTVTINIPYK
ncbi:MULTISPECIES: ATP-binding protein [unclassified Mucilaginibacter]|uniref:sensor histidine kinase n=1 Tax=unclassified Mucilaginibacter TaxID=2617802 RepID=UPI002AC96E91|nr:MULTISPECIES: ATP-binding protein [unclassified Mucilaginibacter]MEB0260313.1 histidine kinase [Mucilaginibacter sp. 10I4]MEB0279352.1 histidine kinase [Mucilaginibacter sp. 10B2]MEB0302208.1 histidine kinase [Mucilaginibacter sp. 5C4]WPX21725.1 histidine kinase [Mucilaginibacter sp. 5C4]